MEINEDQLERESQSATKRWRWVYAALAICILLLLFDHKQEDLIKKAMWTVIYLGLILTYAWPFIIDWTARVTIALLVLLHLPLVLICYPRIPHHNFIVIGIVIAAECGISLIPLAWLDVRSQQQRSAISS